jgi:hypothetical protein
MCHPARRAFVDELREQLPEAEVVWDSENDRWETGARSLLAFDPAASHHLVVQDDAVICPDLLAGVEQLVQFSGEHPVSLYTGKVRPHQYTVTPAVRTARRAGIPWLEFPGPWWGVGLVIPTAHIPELVRWGNTCSRIPNYDRRIERWYENRGVRCWYTMPSLVDHRGVDENPSLVSGRTGDRHAHWFIGAESPLEVDWSRPPRRLGSIAEFRNRQTGGEVSVRVGSSRHRRLLANTDWEAA